MNKLIEEEKEKQNKEKSFYKFQEYKIHICPIIMNYQHVEFQLPIPAKKQIIKLTPMNKQSINLPKTLDVETNTKLVNSIFFYKNTINKK